MTIYVRFADALLPLKLDNTLKMASAMVANLFMLVAVNTISALEAPLFGSRQLAFTSLALYDIATLALVAYYGLLIAVELATDAGEDRQTPRPKRILRRVASNLWIPTTVNFVVVAGLIYASGGITYSPYTPVPLAMMAIGQCLYQAPAVRLGPGGPARRLVSFLCEMLRLYEYPLIMVTVLLVALERLQDVNPLVSTPAPATEIVITTLLSLFTTMCVTFITRRADQATTGTTTAH